MIKRVLIASSAGLALFAAAPVAAQSDEPAQDETVDVADQEEVADASSIAENLFGNMFGEAEPLTADQEARLPVAEGVVEKIFPAGTYAKMMNDTMKPMMDNVMGRFGGAPISEIAKLTGLYASELDGLGDASVDEIMAILDPAFQDRTKVVGNIALEIITDTMSQIEPSYRAGLARAYAVRFTDAELADMRAYFSTPTGAKYAAGSMLIYTDPQVMSAMNEMMPAIMGMMPDMMTRIAEANEQFPPARTFSDLDEDEKAKLAELLGMSGDELEDTEPDIEDEALGSERSTASGF